MASSNLDSKCKETTMNNEINFATVNINNAEEGGKNTMTKTDNIVSFKDLNIGRKTMIGEKKKIDEIIDAPIIITDYEIRDSKHYGNKDGADDYLKLQFYFEDDQDKTLYITFSGSVVLIDQIQQADKAMGGFTNMKTKIVKIKNYCSFT